MRPLVERAAVASVWVSPVVLLQKPDEGGTVHQAVSQGDREHRVVSEPAAGVEEREIGRLDGEGLVDRADDVPGDRSEHRGFPLLPTVNAFSGPLEGSPYWVNFTKVACLDGLSKRKTDALVYVGAAVIPTPSHRRLPSSFAPHDSRLGRGTAT